MPITCLNYKTVSPSHPAVQLLVVLFCNLHCIMVVGIDIGSYKAAVGVVQKGGIDVIMNKISKRITEYVAWHLPVLSIIDICTVICTSVHLIQ